VRGEGVRGEGGVGFRVEGRVRVRVRFGSGSGSGVDIPLDPFLSLSLALCVCVPCLIGMDRSLLCLSN
jgi:hypothetical protein